MRLWHIPLRNLRLRALSSILTSASIALGAGLVALLWIVAGEAEQKYKASAKGFRSVVGPTGTSALDLVLNTVFNLGVPQGVVPLAVYRDLHDDKILPGKRLGIKHAIPIAVGDNYRNYRVVATTDEWFEKFTRAEHGRLAFAQGQGFKFSHEELIKLAEHLAEDAKAAAQGEGNHGHEHEIPEPWRQVVLGAEVARKLAMKLGDQVVPAHEIEGDHQQHDEAACKVVGILAATGTPIDRAVYLPLGVHFLLQGHGAFGKHEQDASVDKVRISAVVVDTRNPVGHFTLREFFQNKPLAQAAITEFEIARLFEIAGDIGKVLQGLAIVVMFVAGIGILVALYNTMNDRKREIAIMRSLGARRTQILSIVLAEATLLAATGALLGVLAAHGITELSGSMIEKQAGVSVAGAPFTLRELWLVLGVMALGAIAGLIPAVKASLTGVAENLSPTT